MTPLPRDGAYLLDNRCIGRRNNRLHQVVPCSDIKTTSDNQLERTENQHIMQSRDRYQGIWRRQERKEFIPFNIFPKFMQRNYEGNNFVRDDLPPPLTWSISCYAHSPQTLPHNHNKHTSYMILSLANCRLLLLFRITGQGISAFDRCS